MRVCSSKCAHAARAHIFAIVLCVVCRVKSTHCRPNEMFQFEAHDDDCVLFLHENILLTQSSTAFQRNSA